jgi:hypothetical protein
VSFLKPIDVYIDLGGFGPNVMARPNNSRVASFFKNLRQFLDFRRFDVKRIFVSACSSQGIMPVPENVQQALNATFTRCRAEFFWSKESEIRLQEEIEKAEGEENLSPDVMLVTNSIYFVPLLQSLKEKKFSLVVCGTMSPLPLRNAATASINMKEVLS